MTIKVFEAFSGVGAQRMALRNIGVDFEVVGTSDWEINTTVSYNAIHTKNPIDYSEELTDQEMNDYFFKIGISSDGKIPLTKDKIKRIPIKKKKDIYNAFRNTKNFGSIVNIKPEDVPDHDLFTYSFPCQAVSVAGNQNGLEKGSGTSSSMLWECQKIIEAKMPKYLLMENVKNLVGKKFKAFFDEWVAYLDDLGYKTYWQVLNAKDYGVPQNRERVFAVSILGDHEPYTFPSKTPLNVVLKDFLEKEVNQKFYVSQDKVDQLLKNLNGKIDLTKQVIGTVHPKNDLAFATRDRVYNGDKIAPTLTSTMYKDAPKILNVGNVNPSGNGMNGEVYSEEGVAPTLTTNKGEGLKVMQIGNIVNTGNWDNPQRGRIYAAEGLSPALNTVGGGGLEPKILEIETGEELVGVDVHPFSKKLEFRGYKESEVSPCLLATDYKAPKTILVKDAETEQETVEIPIGGVYTNDSPKFNRGVKEGLSRTIKSGSHDAGIAFVELPAIGASRGRNPENPSDRSAGTKLEQRFEINSQGISNTITSVTKDNYVLDADDASIIQLGRGFNKGGEHEISPTISANSWEQNNFLRYNFRIRKLTPLECWRLMSFSDEDFRKAEQVNSNSQLYKQAGNSIVVNCLEGIFSQLFIHNDTQPKKHKSKNEEEKQMKLAKDVVVLDFETTGFSPFNDEVTEVGVVILDGQTFEIVGEFNSLIKVNKQIPKKVTEITGITNEMTNAHGLSKEIVGNYLKAVTEDAIVVAHNVQFDFQFLKEQFNIEPVFWYDTLSLSRIIDPNEKSHKLADACARAGVVLENAHRAINDTRATAKLLQYQLTEKDGYNKFNTLSKGKYGIKFEPKYIRSIES